MLSVVVRHYYAYGWLDLRDGSSVAIVDPFIRDDQQNQNNHSKRGMKALSSAMAGALLQYLFSNLTGVGPGSMSLSKDVSGRPWIRNNDSGQPVFASISHSGDRVSAAVDIHRPIGIDIELYRKSLDFHGVARRIFTRQVAELVNTHGEFYRCWCLYEAWIKACGVSSARWQADDRLIPLLKLALENNEGQLADGQAVIFFPVTGNYTGCVMRGCPERSYSMQSS